MTGVDEDGTMSTPDHHVKATATTFRIVEALERDGSAGVTELAQRTGVAKSSVYKHLDTLRELGYVTKSDGVYELSFRFFRVGHRVRERDELFRLAKPEVDELARRTGETVSLVVEERHEAVYLYQASADDAGTAPVEEGGRIPVLVSAAGKAILSYRPFEEVEALPEAATEGRERLESELRTIRNQRLVIERDGLDGGHYSAGFLEGHRHVTDREFADRNIRSAAIPVRDRDDYAVGAIEVSGPASSLSGRRLEEDVASLLVSTGRSIESDLI